MCSATHSSTAVGLLLWCQVPAPFNLEAVMKSKQDDPSALHVVLFQEVCA
jgi:dynein heavy chain